MVKWNKLRDKEILAEQLSTEDPVFERARYLLKRDGFFWGACSTILLACSCSIIWSWFSPIEDLIPKDISKVSQQEKSCSIHHIYEEFDEAFQLAIRCNFQGYAALRAEEKDTSRYFYVDFTANKLKRLSYFVSTPSSVRYSILYSTERIEELPGDMLFVDGKAR